MQSAIRNPQSAISSAAGVPIARTPLNARHRAAGATMQVVEGWEIALCYPSEPSPGKNAVCELTGRSVSELNGPQIDETLQSLCGSAVPLRAIHIDRARHVYRLTRNRAIVFGKADLPEKTDVTGGWTSVGLFGPDTRTLLTKITAVDQRDQALPVGHCCQGPIFGVGTLFGRFQHHYELHVCPDMLEFLWDVILDAGQEFGLKPVGREWAVRELRVET